MKLALPILMGLSLTSFAQPTVGDADVLWANEDTRPVSIAFDGPDLSPLTGSRELMLAKWFAAARERGATGLDQAERGAAGIQVEREVFLSRNVHRPIIRIVAFGVLARDGNAHPIGAQGELRVPPDAARFGPRAYDWSARVRTPLPPEALKRTDDVDLFGLLFQLFENGLLGVEYENEGGSWEPAPANVRRGHRRASPANSGRVQLTEDWYFDSRRFTFHSVVREIY